MQAMLQQLLKRDCSQGYQTINVSTEHETSVNQLLGAFAEVDADKLEVRYAEMRQGDIFRSALSNARLKEILAVTPQMEGIQKLTMIM